ARADEGGFTTKLVFIDGQTAGEHGEAPTQRESLGNAPCHLKCSSKPSRHSGALPTQGWVYGWPSTSGSGGSTRTLPVEHQRGYRRNHRYSQSDIRHQRRTFDVIDAFS